MKNIIVPVDFSEDSLKGLDLAILISKKLKVNIQMVFVQKKTADYYPGTVEKDGHKHAEKRFEQILEEYNGKLGNKSSLNYIIKKGKIYEEIVNQAQSFEDSIITATTHGASGFEELFIGSNAFRIISATDRPVITITKGDVPESFNKIVLPIDITVQTRQKLPMTFEVAKLFDSEVHVISVASSKGKKIQNRLKAYNKQVVEFLNSKKIKTVSDNVYGDNITDITLNYANSIKADLISIMTEQETSLSNILLGSYAHQMLNNSYIPVMSITPKEMRFSNGFQTFGATGLEDTI